MKQHLQPIWLVFILWQLIDKYIQQYQEQYKDGKHGAFWFHFD